MTFYASFPYALDNPLIVVPVLLLFGFFSASLFLNATFFRKHPFLVYPAHLALSAVLLLFFRTRPEPLAVLWLLLGGFFYFLQRALWDFFCLLLLDLVDDIHTVCLHYLSSRIPTPSQKPTPTPDSSHTPTPAPAPTSPSAPTPNATPPELHLYLHLVLPSLSTLTPTPSPTPLSAEPAPTPSSPSPTAPSAPRATTPVFPVSPADFDTNYDFHSSFPSQTSHQTHENAPASPFNAQNDQPIAPPPENAVDPASPKSALTPPPPPVSTPTPTPTPTPLPPPSSPTLPHPDPNDPTAVPADTLRFDESVRSPTEPPLPSLPPSPTPIPPEPTPAPTDPDDDNLVDFQDYVPTRTPRTPISVPPPDDYDEPEDGAPLPVPPVTSERSSEDGNAVKDYLASLLANALAQPVPPIPSLLPQPDIPIASESQPDTKPESPSSRATKPRKRRSLFACRHKPARPEPPHQPDLFDPLPESPTPPSVDLFPSPHPDDLFA